MLSFLGGLLSGILSFLVSFLPDSPVQSWITGLEALQLGLGWLNWFCPVWELMVFFAAWLALLAAWVGLRMALGKTMDIVGKLV